MEGLGASLREARLRRNLSLDDAEQATKVRGAFLEALEQERWDLLPARAYAQGLLAVYARTLGLDPAPLITLMPPDEPYSMALPAAESHRSRGLPIDALPVRVIVMAFLFIVLIAAGAFLLRSVLADGVPFFGSGSPEAPPEPSTATRAPAIAVVTPTVAAGPGATPPATPVGVAPAASPSAATATLVPATPTTTGSPASTATAATPTATPSVTTAPALAGQLWPQAVELLQAAGITAVRREQVSDTIPQEQVISQTPAAGQPLGPDRTITVVVSLGRQGISVPDVVGRPEAEGRTLITQAGLTPGRFANFQGRSDVPDAVLRSVCVGCVLSTSPGAGSQQPQGATVFLAVRKE
ncbi:MAG: PASTA domain-containing protein [Dehalococcoidia bacterium]|nr:PASTA domain-containing protein [Dehalococcoidia bacterium]